MTRLASCPPRPHWIFWQLGWFRFSYLFRLPPRLRRFKCLRCPVSRMWASCHHFPTRSNKRYDRCRERAKKAEIKIALARRTVTDQCNRQHWLLQIAKESAQLLLLSIFLDQTGSGGSWDRCWALGIHTNNLFPKWFLREININSISWRFCYSTPNFLKLFRHYC